MWYVVWLCHVTYMMGTEWSCHYLPRLRDEKEMRTSKSLSTNLSCQCEDASKGSGEAALKRLRGRPAKWSGGYTSLPGEMLIVVGCCLSGHVVLPAKYMPFNHSMSVCWCCGYLFITGKESLMYSFGVFLRNAISEGLKKYRKYFKKTYRPY